MSRSILVLFAALMLASWGTTAAGQGIPQGSYQQTCNNISVNGDTLVANCQDTSGNWHSTSLPAFQNCTSGINNDNGTLRCVVSGYSAPATTGAGPAGSYLQSCENVQVKGDDLHARCRTENGDMRDAKLDDYRKCTGDIVNENGHLHCGTGAPVATPAARGPYVAPGPYVRPGYGNVNGPNGSYIQTCTDIHVGGDDLHARCQAQDGSWHDAKLDDYNSCRGDIANDNGKLRCGAGTPVSGSYAPGRFAGVNGPKGSYTQSCMNIHVDGDDLKARCQTNGGNLRDAKLDDFRKCKSDIINDDGRLRCQK
jgi:hypothetical protein